MSACASMCRPTYVSACHQILIWAVKQSLRIRDQFRLRRRVCVSVCVRSLCRFSFSFFWSNENLHSRPPEDHLFVPHTPGLVHTQLCSVARQLGQQLTHVAASPSYISAFTTQLSNISFPSDVASVFAFPTNELNWLMQLWDRMIKADYSKLWG